MKMYIFAMICPETNKVKFIGKTKNPDRKAMQIFYSDKSNVLTKWVRSFGNISPSMKIIEIVPIDKAKERVEYWSSYYAKDDLINISRVKKNAHVSINFTYEEFQEIKKDALENFNGVITKCLRARIFKKA